MLALRERPSRLPLMLQSWQSLTLLHWRKDPETIQRLLPPGLVVDMWDDMAYVGLVPFKMANVRFAQGTAVPGAHTFPETNVRTYVIGPSGDPGVWFFSLDAASRIAAVGGRLLYGLPYHFAAMEIEVSDSQVAYRSQRTHAESEITTLVPVEHAPAAVGSLEFWLVERYLLYSWRRGRLFSGQVHHVPYPLGTSMSILRRNTMLSTLGLDVHGEPLVHYSPGVDVEVFGLTGYR